MTIVSDLKSLSKKYYGYEGVILEQLVRIFKIWDCWRNGKCDLERLEEELQKLEEILVAN